ncbi:MAG TPA: DUF4340 domain-containing protein [Allocoleopsis sp.]
MKLKSRTLILLLLALGLGGFVYFHEIRGGGKTQEQQASGQQIFGFKEAQVQALTITTPGQRLEFVKAPAAKSGEKSAEQSTEKAAVKSAEAKQAQSQWLLKAPESAPADDAAVAYLLSLLATGRSDRTIKAPVTRKAEFGLDQPTATIEVKLNDQKTHRFVLGKPDFNQSFWYAQADPEASGTQELSVLLVSPDFNNAVSRPFSEWKAAPVAPSPSPAATSAPGTENNVSPEPAPESPSPSPESAPSPEGTSPALSPNPSPSASPAPTSPAE